MRRSVAGGRRAGKRDRAALARGRRRSLVTGGRRRGRTRSVALAPTLYDFDVALANVDAGVDTRLSVKAARHPSESLDRLWLRVLAWCWKWEEGIAFGPGLSDPDAPDLVARDLTGAETLWIRVGKPAPD